MHLKMSSALLRPFRLGLNESIENSDGLHCSNCNANALESLQSWTKPSTCWRNKVCGSCRDDVIKWKHFPRYSPFVRGIHQWPVGFPRKGPVTRKYFHLVTSSCNVHTLMSIFCDYVPLIRRSVLSSTSARTSLHPLWSISRRESRTSA